METLLRGRLFLMMHKAENDNAYTDSGLCLRLSLMIYKVK